MSEKNYHYVYKLIDKIISEPLGGAHNDREKIFKSYRVSYQ